MHLLIASVFIWLALVYLVVPIAKFIVDGWPLLIAGIIALIAFRLFKSDGRITGGQTISDYVGTSSQISAVNRAAEGVTLPPSRPMGLPITSVDVPKRGLVVNTEYLDKILSGQKTVELRGKHNRQLGPIALIKKGTKRIYAVAEIAESFGPMSLNELRERSYEHGVVDGKVDAVFARGWVYGWRLRNVVVLPQPVPYVHKGMSQVLLDPEAIEELRAQLALLC